MTTDELIERIADRQGLSAKHVRRIVRDLLDIVRETVAEGEPVRLARFGTFRRNTLRARETRNPATGQPMFVPERHSVRFKPYRVWIDQCNEEGGKP